MSLKNYEEKMAVARTLIITWGKEEKLSFPVEEIRELLEIVQYENNSRVTRNFRSICAQSLEMQCRYDILPVRSQELHIKLSQLVDKLCA